MIYLYSIQNTRTRAKVSYVYPNFFLKRNSHHAFRNGHQRNIIELNVNSLHLPRDPVPHSFESIWQDIASRFDLGAMVTQ